MTGEIVQFPGADVASEAAAAASDRACDALHGEAFRDLEGPLFDCASLAKLAADRIHQGTQEDCELVFAVTHSREMLSKLLKDYYADYERQS